MSLHIEKLGQGEPLVMIHGWGMHSGMWMQARDLLSEYFELHMVDLPGMGHSETLDVYNLHSVAEKIAEKIPSNAYMLGWSLGGLIATKIALMTPIKKLILVGSTPCFVARDDWQQGMPKDTARLRISLSAAHTEADVRLLIKTLQQAEVELMA